MGSSHLMILRSQFNTEENQGKNSRQKPGGRNPEEHALMTHSLWFTTTLWRTLLKTYFYHIVVVVVVGCCYWVVVVVVVVHQNLENSPCVSSGLWPTSITSACSDPEQTVRHPPCQPLPETSDSWKTGAKSCFILIDASGPGTHSTIAHWVSLQSSCPGLLTAFWMCWCQRGRRPKAAASKWTALWCSIMA